MARSNLELRGTLHLVAVASEHELEALIRGARPILWSTAVRYSNGHIEDAEDLLQDASIRACLYRHAYDSRRPFLPWFEQILRNAAAERWRKLGTRPVTGIETAQLIGCRDEILADWVADLRDSDRSLVYMRCVEQRTYPEIASRLGVSCTTARRRWLHLCQRLHGVMR